MQAVNEKKSKWALFFSLAIISFHAIKIDVFRILLHPLLSEKFCQKSRIFWRKSVFTVVNHRLSVWHIPQCQTNLPRLWYLSFALMSSHTWQSQWIICSRFGSSSGFSMFSENMNFLTELTWIKTKICHNSLKLRLNFFEFNSSKFNRSLSELRIIWF